MREYQLMDSYQSDHSCLCARTWGHPRGHHISYLIQYSFVDAGVVRKWYADDMEDMASANTGLEGKIIRERATLLYNDDNVLGA